MPAWRRCRQVSLQVKRLSRIVVDQEPVRPDASGQGVEDRRDRPVPAAFRGRRPDVQPLPQLYQGVPDAIVMLSANPPDNLVFVSMPVNILGRYFCLANSAHAGNKLRRGMRPSALSKVRA